MTWFETGVSSLRVFVNTKYLAPSSISVAPIPQKEWLDRMDNRLSRAIGRVLTWPRIVFGIITLLAGLSLWFGVRWIDQIQASIPLTIQNEVTRQLPDAVKKEVPGAVKTELTAQLSQRITDDIASKTQQTQSELFKRQDAYQQAIDQRINGIWQIVMGNKKVLGRSLKNSVSGNEVAVKRTIQPGRELLQLAHAKAKAASSSKDAPIISPQDFNNITRYLFREFEDPDLNTELWQTTLEFASYKTVANGVEFGWPRPNQYSGYTVNIGDEDIDFTNAVFLDAHILLKEGCPVTLRNVRFVRSTFEVPNVPTGRMLLKKLLTSDGPTLTFIIAPPPGYNKGACEK